MSTGCVDEMYSIKLGGMSEQVMLVRLVAFGEDRKSSNIVVDSMLNDVLTNWTTLISEGMTDRTSESISFERTR